MQQFLYFNYVHILKFPKIKFNLKGGKKNKREIDDKKLVSISETISLSVIIYKKLHLINFY